MNRLPLLGLMFLLVGAAARADGTPIVEVFATAPQADAGSVPGLLPLGAGANAGIASGDSVFLVSGAAVRSVGTICAGGRETAVASLHPSITAPPPGTSLLVLRRAALADLADRLPPGVTVSAAVLRVPPGRGSCWIDLGASAGFREGDTILIRRPVREVALPIARGRLARVEDRLALAELRPVVQMEIASVQPGDLVERWPRPYDARMGRVNSAVLQVQPVEGSTRLFLAGGTRDGIEEGRLVDLFRDGSYIGVAGVTEVDDTISVAGLITAASTDQPPREGDEARVRPSRAEGAYPLSAVIFQVVEAAGTTYGLIAAGESDGVEVGDRFLVERRNTEPTAAPHVVAELRVEKVDLTFCRATIRSLDAAAAPVAAWEMAELVAPRAPSWRAVGIVRDVDAEQRLARVDLDPTVDLVPGAVLRWVPEQPAMPPGAAILLTREGSSGWLFVPPGWGALSMLRLARLESGTEPDGVASRRAPESLPSP